MKRYPKVEFILKDGVSRLVFHTDDFTSEEKEEFYKELENDSVGTFNKCELINQPYQYNNIN